MNESIIQITVIMLLFPFVASYVILEYFKK